MCIKLKNAGKHVSQQWQFQGIARALQPRYVVLVDAGTRPLGDAVLRLCDAMHANPQLGGVCGRIKPPKAPAIWEGITYVQTFEYAASHYLDKVFDSLTG